MACIVIYDSGVGGLTIYQQLAERLGQAIEQHSLVFVSDNEAYPYGTKRQDKLLLRVSLVAQRIVQAYSPDILVIACNTASTIALDSLRQQLDCKVVGVVPAIKPAAILSNTNVIGVLATPATIKRDYTNQLIDDFAKHCNVISVGSGELVEMAEAKLAGQVIDGSLLTEILQPFITCIELDVLVLACTHFPLLSEEIERVFVDNNRSISLLDSGRAIAQRIMSLSTAVAKQEDFHAPIASFTKALDQDLELENHLQALGFLDIHQLKIN